MWFWYSFQVSPDVINTFDFRVLRQNRRITKEKGREQELEHFHEILQSISMGHPTDDVRRFLVQAYVRGARVGCAENVPLEGSTAIFTKRRYRDAWNRTVLRRLAKNHAHSLKIRAKVKAKGSESFFGQRRSNWVRSKARTQALWSLHLAGDFHETFENVPIRTNHIHKMRVMIISNLAVDQRFANGGLDDKRSIAYCIIV